MIGGMAAVLYTDTLQCFIMVIGALLLATLSFIRVGGFAGLLASYGQAIASTDLQTADSGALLLSLTNVTLSTNITSRAELAAYSGVDPSLGCSLPSPKAFRLLREVDDPDMPWLGFILGHMPLSIWYWCTDQMVVQRVLTAKNLSHAQGDKPMAGVIKQLPLFVMVTPGSGGSERCQSEDQPNSSMAAMAIG
ncbi:solute carrier family 5 (sodium/myo-inositol cotransporter), member 3 [Paragonimus westermani]|uniref:Solute carrier family 5 (Sodium/myo-inositol cotransporter), member 3 n=1 Tax=Paragonimus westermani TaxID=34504 RepID=A0A5J4N700_9TREM|nr:solute carrier family 5 (sodium/myo-inositol cotransporter), member 3 [Paragonimus westermani]